MTYTVLAYGVLSTLDGNSQPATNLSAKLSSAAKPDFIEDKSA